MITNIVITIEGTEFNAVAYSYVDSETGAIDQVCGLLIEEQGLDFSSLLRNKAFHDRVCGIVQECFEEDCEEARKRKLEGLDI
jgi:hypothetical protein